MKNQPYIINITFDKHSDAIAICKKLLELKLIACGQVSSPIQSLYWWQGTVEDNKEFLLQVKTFESKLVDVEKAVKKMHPYEVPEIIGIKINFISEDYLGWMKEEIV